tara:strand:- start:995 stop:1777 length:783 start_codon:yes stop_codon:yes gene_type:complete
MNNKPIISIIMNCYNGEAFLNEAINSITKQTFENWELIFFDNNSKDNSEKIVKSFKDSRIKYFKSDRLLNLYDARNLAVKKTNGDYISFLDTDDMWTKDKLEKQINFIKKNSNYKILYSNYYVLKNNEKQIMYKNELPSGFITQKLLDFYGIGINTAFLDKSIFDQYNFKKDLNIIGDFDFFIKTSKKFEIGYISDPLTFYRIHENSFTKKNYKMYINELSNWIRENEKTLLKNNYSLKKQKFYVIKLKIKSFLERFLKL